MALFDGRPSGEVLMATGAVEPGNPSDSLEMMASLVAADRLYSMKKEIVEDQGFGEDPGLSLGFGCRRRRVLLLLRAAVVLLSCVCGCRDRRLLFLCVCVVCLCAAAVLLRSEYFVHPEERAGGAGTHPRAAPPPRLFPPPLPCRSRTAGLPHL